MTARDRTAGDKAGYPAKHGAAAGLIGVGDGAPAMGNIKRMASSCGLAIADG